MSKSSRFRTAFDSQHVKGSKTLLKSARQHFCLIVSSLWEKLSWKTSLLVISEILGLFVHTLKADDKYFLHNRENLTRQIQMQFFQTPKTFSQFFAAFLKSPWTFEHFEKEKGSLTAYVFPKLLTSKDILLKCLKGPVSEHPLTVTKLKGPKNYWKLYDSTYIQLFHRSERSWVGKHLT